MRHRKDHRKLSRTASHRKAMLRNQVTSLFLHERIETSVAKAKESRRLAERLITYAKRNDLHARRLVARYVRRPDAVQKVFDEIVPLYENRQGGYTRVLRTRRRLGDAGEMAILELVRTPEQLADKRRETEALLAAAEPEKKSLMDRIRGVAGGGKKDKKDEESAEAPEGDAKS